MSAPDSFNPYAPPAAPVELDFREAAVAESERLLAGRSPDDVPFSVVIPADHSGVRRLNSIGRMTLVRLLLGVGGLLLGGVLAAIASRLDDHPVFPKEIAVAAAVLCSGGGIGLLLLSPFLARRAVRRALGERFDRLCRQSTLRPPVCIGVEDALTFTKIKIAPEDFAWIAFDLTGRRLVLEGLLFRYVIQAADVISADQVSGSMSTGVQIVFRVGTVVVGVTLQYDSFWHELKKQTIAAGKDPLVEPIQQVFGMV
jgi:hypothetical protein